MEIEPEWLQMELEYFIWTSMPIISQYNSYTWTSMPIFSQSNSYNWTSMAIISQTIPYNWTSKLDFNCWTSLNFQFSSITHLFDRIFSIPTCRMCFYRPYGPFSFSTRFGKVLEKRYQKSENGGGDPHFWDYCENELILWR